MSDKYIMALDRGTTSCRAIIFDKNQNILAVSQKEFTQIYPQRGWVEHDRQEIFAVQSRVIKGALDKAGLTAKNLRAIGITNQRETTVLWDKNTGLPVYNAIVWQCRRTAGICKELGDKGLTDYIKKTTGLLIDPYFSGTKIKWIFDNVAGVREKAERGEILFGTIDSWLLYCLSGGRVHATDYTNAARTMIFDIHNLKWDEKLLAELGIPRGILPAVYPSQHLFGYADIDGVKVPVAGMAGDQQSALFGQKCFEPGQAKNTYGTGCFLLMNTGRKAYDSKTGLVTTIAAGAGDKVSYALEGSVFTGGSVIQWLRDELKIINEAPDAEYFAGKVADTGGVYIVPAFTGLGAPWWNMYRRGAIFGITRGTKREHIIRAAQESIAYQTLDLVRAMEEDTGMRLSTLNVDGGAARDSFLMQFQADVLGRQVYRPKLNETTALGAALLAGLEAGYWTEEEIAAGGENGRVYSPAMQKEKADELIKGWHKAVRACLAHRDEE